MTRTLAFITLFCVLIGGAIWTASVSLTKASERTVTYQYISDALDALSARPSFVTWQPGQTEMVREFTEGDGVLIGQAMTEAWSSLALAQYTGESAILSDGFSGVAQERATRSVQDAGLGGQMVVLSQEARPVFYHLDGSVFQAEVEMLVSRYLIQDGALVHYEMAVDQAVTTLMNESNGWRVYAHEREGVDHQTSDRPGWSGPPLAGVNYYPALTPWREFWPGFDAAVIADDFEQIELLGGNAVRIFLTAQDFADPATQDVALDNLAEMLGLADEAGLWVIPTLFDLKHSFDPGGWGQDYASLQAILPVLNQSPAVAMVDLKNEPDLDFEANGKAHILAWLRTMAELTRIEAPDLPVTVGWAHSEAALELADVVDVITYHDYADVETSAQRLASIQAASDLPVMITEIGATSYEVALGFPGSDAGQQTALEERMSALSNADGVFVWTLYDFPDVDAAAVGGSPWVQRLQSQFGLLTAEGGEKPAASAVREAFDQIRGR